MKRKEIYVLYKRGRDLIMFDFILEGDEIDVIELMNFHFCERHDFNERIEKTALTIFKNFYDESNDGEEEFIDWEYRLN